MAEETDWIGGQLTAQAVPPDEHPWIEQFGCTARYRRYRNLVRSHYREHTPLLGRYRDDLRLNPGGGWVSRLCHEPGIGHQVLQRMLAPYLATGQLRVLLKHVPVEADVDGDEARCVTFVSVGAREELTVWAPYVLDATELGDLLRVTDTEYVVGAESKADTGEEHAVDGPAEPQNVQGLTWVFAMAHDEGSNRVIDRPEQYEGWRAFQPKFWPGPLIGFDDLNPQTNRPRHIPLFSDDWFCLFKYRQIVEPSRFEPGTVPHPVTIVNWPMNDYFLGSVIDVDDDWNPAACDHVPYAGGETSAERLLDAKELSWCLLYWLQTEAPRPDGGVGYPGLYLRPDIMGTDDGFAKAAYIRESRRIVARATVREYDVSAAANPGRDRGREYPDSIGIGAYRVDLHPSTSGESYIDFSSLPFQIPLGALVPVRMKNIIPAAKNIGVTHITNGCYRLHPVEWNIGEAAGLLAAFCWRREMAPARVYENSELTKEFQQLLIDQGVEIEWPQLRAL
ncbi:FAD dependent oxidoreductase [Fimbriimonas ginsengisoli Gsoil 348]|uniref:FAD dependent oxidoreductase n=2 Tax=Fimbriimonas ginsengisoli TaxID=1005039 RepID=A0A068NR64_FIMGI|nr:FAD dependent oxidoreductase [Fimbriimonas ginsengisoli Gsoil 348]